MSQITEIKRTLDGRVDHFPCEVVTHTTDELIVRYHLTRAYHVHGLDLPAGSVTIAYFWPARPYNLYHWLSPEGRTYGYYFNIGDVVRLAPDVIEWDDLAVDVLATPDGQVQVLDEDELPSDLSPARRTYIEAARDEVLRDLGQLVTMAEQRSAPLL